MKNLAFVLGGMVMIGLVSVGLSRAMTPGELASAIKAGGIVTLFLAWAAVTIAWMLAFLFAIATRRRKS